MTRRNVQEPSHLEFLRELQASLRREGVEENASFTLPALIRIAEGMGRGDPLRPLLQEAWRRGRVETDGVLPPRYVMLLDSLPDDPPPQSSGKARIVKPLRASDGDGHE